MARFPKDGSETEFARYTKRNWDDQDAFYMFWVERWKRTMDFLRSIHWRTLQELDLKQIPEWKRFPVINFTLAFYSDYLSQFLQSRVRFSAVPDGPDQQSIAGAEIADHALKYLWDKLQMDEKKTDLAAWLAATGNADMRVFWDADTGNMLPLAIPGPDGQLIPVNPETLQPDPNMQEPIMVDAGEIGLEVVPPQLMRWGQKRSDGLQIGYLVTYDDACNRYGDQVAENLRYSELKGSLATDLLSVYPEQGMPRREETALVVEQYVPRSSKNPQGLWWTAHETQLITKPAPLPISRIPAAHFRWVPVPGHKTMGLSPLYDITFSNKIYDEMTARVVEWLGKVVPKFVRFTGDGMSDKELTDEPGQELKVNAGAEPKWISVVAPPPHFTEQKQASIEDSLLVGGYKLRRPAEAAQGTAAGGVRNPLKTRNEGEVMTLAVVNSKPAWNQLGYILLGYAGKFYTESRMTAVVGKDRTYQWREFSGSDLENLPATIHVDEAPLYTWNRSAQRDVVIALLGSPAGQFMFMDANGQVDKNRINAAMESAGIDVSPDTLDPDVMEARNENHMFRTWQPGTPPPSRKPWNNDAAHFQEHQVVPKSLEFSSRPQEQQQAFLAHMAEHEQAIQQANEEEKKAMLDQERALREIRAQAETSQAIKTAFGENISEALMELLTKKEPPKKKKGA